MTPHHAQRPFRSDLWDLIDSLPAVGRQAVALSRDQGWKAMRWTAERLAHLPLSILHQAARTYVRTTEDQSQAAANLALLETDELLGSARADLVLDDAALCDYAQRRADALAAWLRAGRDPNTMYTVAAEYCRRHGIEPPAPPAEDAPWHPVLLRLSCPYWWRRRLRHTYRRKAEHQLSTIDLGPCAYRPYVSDWGMTARAGQRARLSRLMEQLVAVSDAGDQVPMADIVEASTANPRCRFAELMVRIRGAERLAASQHLVGAFLTITAPSRFHPMTDGARSPNPNYQGATPRDTQAYLSAIWARARRQLKRENIPMFGLRVAEPHKDGCPHWHIIAWFDPIDCDRALEIIRNHAMADSPDEPGAARHRFTSVMIDPARGSASGYVIKYLAKHVPTGGDFTTGDDSDQGDPADTTRDRIDAWASIWGIRRFAFFGLPSVGPWRMLRAAEARLVAGADQDLIAMHQAAVAGQYDQFATLNGWRPFAPRRPLLAWVSEPNPDTATGLVHLTRYHEQRPDRKVGLQTPTSVLCLVVKAWRIVRRGTLGLVSITERVTSVTRHPITPTREAAFPGFWDAQPQPPPSGA